MSRIATLLLIAATTTLVGCRGTGLPRMFGGQGSAAQQQHEAQQFDPYPETNIGPSVTGGRPEGYTTPAPEATRGTSNRWTLPWFSK